MTLQAHRARDLFFFALWLGLVYGLSEALILQSLIEFSTVSMWRNGVNPRIFWVAPLVNGAIFAAVGSFLAGLLILARGPRRPRAWVLSVMLLCGLAGFGLTMTSRALSSWAVVIVTVGAVVRGFQLGRARTELGFARRSLAAVLAVVLLAGVGGEAWMRRQESVFLAGLPPATADRPNVLIVIIDTGRADHLSSYGYGRPTTPNLDAIAREGTLFEWAYSTSHWSHPGHTAILEGWYGVSRIYRRFFAEASPHAPLAQVMSRQGYATFVASANSMWFTPKAGFGVGFARFNVYFHNLADAFGRTYLGKMPLLVLREQGGWFDAPWRKRAERVNQELLDWIDKSQELGRPFFAVANYMDTHDPFWPPEPFTHRFNSELTRRGLLALHAGSHPRPNISESERQLVIDAYDSCLAYLDEKLGQLFDELKRRGKLDNTLLVITADHGEALGEGRVWGHTAPILRQEVSRVPLIVRFPPAVAANVRVGEPVSIRQIPATVTALLGLDDRARYDAEALSSDPSVVGEGVLIGLVDRRALAFEQWVLLDDVPRKQRFLYDMSRDPNQTENLSGRPEFADTERLLLERLARLRKSLHAAGVAENRDVGRSR